MKYHDSFLLYILRMYQFWLERNQIITQLYKHKSNSNMISKCAKSSQWLIKNNGKQHIKKFENNKLFVELINMLIIKNKVLLALKMLIYPKFK